MPLTKENMQTVNALVKEGRINEARRLLRGLDGEKAAAALVKLNERYPVKATSNNRLFTVIMGISLVAAVSVLIVVYITRIIPAREQTDLASHRISVEYEVRDACDEYYARQGIAESSFERCKQEAIPVMTTYPDIVDQCFKDYADIDTMMLYCLEENKIVFGE